MAQASEISFKLFLHTINTRMRTGSTAIEEVFLLVFWLLIQKLRDLRQS
jgi:hypothetical protein